MFGVSVSVRKQREVWLYQNARIHLDRVRGLGDFVEIEVVVHQGSLDPLITRLPVSGLEGKFSLPYTVACALVRPSKSLADLEVASVKKKLKDKGFARGVSREDVYAGAEELGMPLDDLIAFLLQALRPHERVIGLGAP